MKLINAGILVMAVSAVLTGCKSPVPKEEAVVTVAAAVDTIAPIVKIVPKDTVALIPSLTVIINNLESSTAPVTVSVYGPKNKFLDKHDQLKEYKFTPNGKTLVARITGLAFGDFGIATYQDVNSNGKIDQNLIGIPKEPYGFSNNFEPTIKAPRFKDCQFCYSATADTIFIAMIR